MFMKKITVFIDESGTLPDPNDKVIIIAAVGTDIPEKINVIIKEIRKKGKFRKQTGELKFYTAGERSRISFLKRINNNSFDIFVLSVEKSGRKIPDTPSHFAILCWLLLCDVLNFYAEVENIIFDRHFSSKVDIERFDKSLRSYLNIKTNFEHVDSKKDKRVNVADMIAGAVLLSETGKDPRFYECIRDRVISFKRLNWVEAKQKIFKK